MPPEGETGKQPSPFRLPTEKDDHGRWMARLQSRYERAHGNLDNFGTDFRTWVIETPGAREAELILIEESQAKYDAERRERRRLAELRKAEAAERRSERDEAMARIRAEGEARAKADADADAKARAEVRERAGRRKRRSALAKLLPALAALVVGVVLLDQNEPISDTTQWVIIIVFWGSVIWAFNSD